jgi:hypothetical protein
MFYKKGRGALWVCIWNQGGGGPKKFGSHWCRFWWLKFVETKIHPFNLIKVPRKRVLLLFVLLQLLNVSVNQYFFFKIVRCRVRISSWNQYNLFLPQYLKSKLTVSWKEIVTEKLVFQDYGSTVKMQKLSFYKSSQIATRLHGVTSRNTVIVIVTDWEP